MLDIRRATKADWERIESFYRQRNYNGIKPQDTIFIVQVNNRLVGAVRICLEENVLVLRGMQIFPAFQRQGIGTKLLQMCDRYLNRQTCYCLPFSHLEQFYKQIGFEKVNLADVPSFLRARHNKYLGRGLDVIAMSRSLEG